MTYQRQITTVSNYTITTFNTVYLSGMQGVCDTKDVLVVRLSPKTVQSPSEMLCILNKHYKLNIVDYNIVINKKSELSRRTLN